MTWLTQSSWTCCLSLRDWAKRRTCMEFCRTWEAGSWGWAAHLTRSQWSPPVEIGGASPLLQPAATTNPLLTVQEQNTTPPAFSIGNTHRLLTFIGHSNLSLLKSAYDKPKKSTFCFPFSKWIDSSHTRSLRCCYAGKSVGLKDCGFSASTQQSAFFECHFYGGK